MTFDKLRPEVYPMLCAFRTLNASLSNSAQSSPWCHANYTEEDWFNIEEALAGMEARNFVFMAVGDALIEAGIIQYEELWNQPEFKDWARTWE